MLTDSRAIMARLIRDGWTVDRVKGSHHVFKRTDRAAIVVLPHPKKDLPKGTVRSIYRNPGWETD